MTQEIAALHAQMQRELEREFPGSEPDNEDHEPVQEEASEGRKEKEWVPVSLKAQEEAQADPSSVFTSPIVQAYREHGAETQGTGETALGDPSSAFTSPITRAYREYVETPEEEQERTERRWYEEWYHRTVETVQHYWRKFVDKIASWREERDREIEGPER